jgi:hypothetical protein
MTTRFITPYSAQTTADDVVAGLDLTGRRIIVTGGASGIGIGRPDRWPALGPKSRSRSGTWTPGGRSRRSLQRYVSDDELDRMRAATGNSAPAWKTPQQGAATSVLLAAAPLLDGVGGKYFEDCNEALPAAPGTRRGVAAHALDPEAAARLWQVSADTVGA